MRLSPILVYFDPTKFGGRAVLYFVLPTLLICTIGILYSFYNERVLIGENLHNNRIVETSSCAAQIECGLEHVTAVFGAVGIRREFAEAAKDNTNAFEKASQMLRVLQYEMPDLSIQPTSVFLYYKGEISYITPPPSGSDFSEPQAARTFIAATVKGQRGFVWSRPLNWTSRERAVAAVQVVAGSDPPLAFGAVFRLNDLRKVTSDAALNLGDCAGVFIYDRTSQSLWYPFGAEDNRVDERFSLPELSNLPISLFDLLKKSVGYDEQFEMGSDAYSLVISPVKAGELTLGVVYSQHRLESLLLRNRISAGLLIAFLWIAVLLFAFGVVFSVTGALSSLSKGIPALGDGKDFEFFSGLTEAGEVWEEFVLYYQAVNMREQKNAEASYDIRSSLQKYRELLEVLPEGYILARLDGAIVEFNGAVPAMTGYLPAELNHLTVGDLVKRISDRTVPTGRDSIASPQVLVLRRKEGPALPIAVVERQVRSGIDSFILYLVRDISREEEMREGLLSQAARLEGVAQERAQEVNKYRLAAKELLEQLMEGVLRIDGSGNIVDCNAAAVRVFLFPARNEMIGVNIFKVLKFSDTSGAGIEKFLSGGSAAFPAKVTFSRFDGSRGSALISCRLFDDGNPRLFELIVNDVSVADEAQEALSTYRKEMGSLLGDREEELRKTQRQLIDHAHRAGMAEVASEVLHNIGNALNSIGIRLKGMTDLLAKERIAERLKDLATSDKKPDNEQYKVYMTALASALVETRAEIQANAAFISEKLAHIGEIISLQQAIARVRGIVEEMNVSDIILDAVEMNRESLNKRGINVSFNFGKVPI
ncbi:MAG: PAS domain-containing protein, partial [Candidatus Brocadiia bacterium]